MITKNIVSTRMLIRALGFIFTCIALFFVFERIWGNSSSLFNEQPVKKIVIVIAVGSIMYSLCCFLLSSAWQRLLCWFGQSNTSIKICYYVYARTQIAKYIPGNIFHVANRHLLGRQVGFGHLQLTGAALYEIIGVLFASSAIALLGIVLYGSSQTKVSKLSILVVFFAMLFMPIILNLTIAKFSKFRRFNLPEKKIIEIMKDLLLTYFFYLVFFLMAGGILFGVSYSVSNIEIIHHAGFVFTVFAVSWIVGFITPGSPAGLGVREAILVFSLTNVIGESESLLVALIFRMITVIGDVIFFLSAFVVGRNILLKKNDNHIETN